MAFQSDIEILEKNKDKSISKSINGKDFVHQFSEDEINALIAALATKRPLLITGEPGVGKTETALAAALLLERYFISEVINHSHQCNDLKYQFDDMSRLGAANALTRLNENVESYLNPKKYLSPGVLWWATNHDSASTQFKNCDHPLVSKPSLLVGDEKSADLSPSASGSVLLIDEIDKGSYDLTNGLLDVFGSRSFKVPHFGEVKAESQEHKAPLIIITSNGERELPSAFVRRCVLLPMNLPKNREALISVLIQRGKLHYPSLDEDTLLFVAEHFYEDRVNAQENNWDTLPGQAEFLDMLMALESINRSFKKEFNQTTHETWFKKIRKVVFQKNIAESLSH